MGGYDGLEVRASLALPAEPASARDARRLIRDFCAAAELDQDLCETAALLASELVTNAILHGRTRATLTAEQPDGRLRVSVEDANPTLPEPGEPVDLGAEGGRGLRIVAALAQRWGVDTTGTGKVIWFELDLP